jgi:hypothetical protein
MNPAEELSVGGVLYLFCVGRDRVPGLEALEAGLIKDGAFVPELRRPVRAFV